MYKMLAMVLAVGCGKGDNGPDGVWKVTVSNDPNLCEDVGDYGAQPANLTEDDYCGTNCTGAKPDFEGGPFKYEVFIDGALLNIRIDGEQFASGTIDGCKMSYDTPVLLESRKSGNIQWSIKSKDTWFQGDQPCSGLSKSQYDWLGYETITVDSSEDEDFVAGCTYSVAVVGKYEGKGE